MTNKQTKIIMGWDCHGLPIELQVDKKLKKKKRNMTKNQIIDECRIYAKEQISNQKKQFQRLGVFSNWDYRYHTMNYDYEATIIREFAKHAKEGVLFKGDKPVHWCPSCVTALAEAEIEYDDHTSFSVYVKFLLNYKFDVNELKDKSIYIVIWTTTPWTLPANLGISLHPRLDYCVVKHKEEYLIIAKELIESVKKDAELEELEIIHTFKGELLDKEKAKHPFIDRDSLIMNGEHVSLDAGTGCVHTAPGHGMDDYVIGKKYGLEPFNPVNDYGKYNDLYPQMEGTKISDANKIIENLMQENNSLLNKPGKRIRHSYPHCWRCSNPVIFRATPQWFIALDNDYQLRKKALNEIKKVDWIPTWGESRINGMIENRPDWCISRQRTWGIPIPTFYCNDCNKDIISQEAMEKVAKEFEVKGINAWHENSAEYFLGNYKCECGSNSFRKETDILDVWFDSGVSYAAVMENMQQEELPVDLYLEGSDQHRGWFHSSLLTSVITRKKAPYKKVLTHGFVMAADGKKLSKKLKNYESPQKFINRNGVEILRLWVAAEDYKNDIRFGQTIIDRIKEAYRKFRNTTRYALSNLYDFNYDENKVEFKDMHPLDKWTMIKLNHFVKNITKSYDNYEFHMIYYNMNEFCASDLSSFYFSIIKDTLYVEKANSKKRRSIQTVLFHIANYMARLLAPIMSFTSEEIYAEIGEYSSKKESVFLENIPVYDESLEDENILNEINKLRKIKDAIQKELEKMRKEKTIGQNLDAMVEIVFPESYSKDILESKYSKEEIDELANFLIVSQVKVLDKVEDNFIDTDIEGLKIRIAKANGEKCERCWTWSTNMKKDSSHPNCCPRCLSVIKD